MTRSSDSPGLPPVAPMSLPARLRAVREFHTGPAVVRDVAGPVVRVPLGPRLVVPPFVVVTSPQGAHDVLAGSNNDTMDKLTPIHLETRLIGDNVFNLPYEAWKPQRRTLQPLFTKRHVANFAGHMATAADERASGWVEGALLDLDRDMRGLTLRVLGRSLFGVDLDQHASDLGPSIQRVLNYITSRGLRPVRAPKSLPTPARRRFRAALADIHALIDEAIAGCEGDPDRDCELVRLLLAARDPDTGRPLTRDEVVSDLAVFLIAGHDTTSTTLTYALWALGHHPELQDRVANEVGQLGDRSLTVDDIPAAPVHRAGHPRGASVVPTSGRARPARDPRHGGGRVPGRTGYQSDRRDLRAPPRPSAVGRPGDLRPGPIQRRAVAGPGPLAVLAVRGRRSLVHR